MYDAAGRPVPLGHKLGRGGEGTVYEVASDPGLVAKLYHEPVDRRKADKLAGMAQAANTALLEIAAWPTATLHTSPGGRLTGLLMPKVVGYRPVHHLYGPAHRKIEFPTADWAFLVHTARNVASAVDTIHTQGHVIGDVNQGNIVVSPKAIIKLIDCDSFQVQVNGQRYLCEVGVAEFTPPELQCRSFQGVVRGPNHDNFGLAVMLFHLLFMGRHPFAGRFAGPGAMPIQQAIEEFRFAFSQHAASRQMTPPPHALRLASVSFGVASLFERAFSPAAARDGTRPTAREWVTALDTLKRELRPCAQYPGHKYHGSLGTCPWCEIERGGGPDFFIAVTAAGRVATGFDLQAIWAQIIAVPPPETASPQGFMPTGPVNPTPLPPGVRWMQALTVLAGLGTLASGAGALLGPGLPIGVAILLGICWLVLRNSGGYAAEREKRRQALKAAEQALATTQARWKRDTDEAQMRFQAKRRDLEQKRSEYLGLNNAWRQDLAHLEAQRPALQLKRYLERFFIDRHQIAGIGSGLKATLASFGIETAADVAESAILAVPGFGPARTRELMNWRRNLERGFRFDPSKGVDPADIAALNQQYARKRQELERVLVTGPQELQRLRAMAVQQRETLLPEIRRLEAQVAQAKSDAALV